MAYDGSNSDKLLNLGQGMIITEAIKEYHDKEINSLTATDIAYGDTNVSDELDKLKLSTGEGVEVATDEEVKEMLNDVFGTDDTDDGDGDDGDDGGNTEPDDNP